MQNLKLDVIYHQSPSDFEMEFNLCGCCRMRLLSDKTSDKKDFIKALARDVSRSRVIIVCGPLFGEDGIIKTVAKAIGNNITACDNKSYGINSDDRIDIISGSTPLVTNDGYFGGCIIESGPQVIILLTENKAFRKSIMQNLIHPYIEEISYIPTKTSPVTISSSKQAASEPATAITETENYITEKDEDYTIDDDMAYVSENSLESEHNIAFVMDNEEPPAEEIEDTVIDSAFNNLYTESELPDEIKERAEQPYTPSESDNMFVFDLEKHEQHPAELKGKEQTLNITLIIMILLLMLAVLTLVYLVVLRPITMGIGVSDYIKEIFGIVSSNQTLV